MKNFNEIFMKDVTYDNIKSYKKTRLDPVTRGYILEKIPAFQGLNSSLLAKYPDSPLTEILKNRLIKIIITLYIFAETSHNFLMKPAFKCFLDCKCCYFPILKALLQRSHIFSQTELLFKDLDLIFLIFTIPPYSQNEKRVIVLRSRFL